MFRRLIREIALRTTQGTAGDEFFCGGTPSIIMLL